MTIVTDEAMRTTVFKVASGTLTIDDWSGQVGAPVRRSAYEENSEPNSITSEARNSHTPSLGLVSPVSGLTSVVYGICMAMQRTLPEYETQRHRDTEVRSD